MLIEWLRRTLRRFKAERQPGQPSKPSAPSPPASRDEWTISGVHFDTTGWRLTQASATSMRWVGDRGGTMTLTKEPLVASNHQTLTLDAARRAHRALAAGANGGILSVEPVLMRNGHVALEVLTKRPQSLGYGFEGLVTIAEAHDEYAIRISAAEAFTGIRESIVSAQMWQLGEIQLPQVMDVPADRSTGGRRIPGLTQDPYDSAYDDDAVYAASDDPRLDPMFPEHPLTIIRAALLRARESWVSDTQPGSHGFDATGPASPGPRVILSLSALREIYWSAGRNDLLEGELTAAISSVDPRGDSADPKVARLLTMLGVVQHNSRNFLNARVTLVRARDILTTAAGAGHRETGVALALLGRTQASLCLLAEAEQSFRRAIAILEKAPDGGLPLLNAIALFGEMLASQKRVDEAIPLIERAKRLLANRPSGGGPALLREVVGGPPPAVNARIKVVR